MLPLGFAYLHALGVSHQELFFLDETFGDGVVDVVLWSGKTPSLRPDRLRMVRENARKRPFGEFRSDFENTGARLVSVHDGEYPELLRHAHGKPWYFSVLGKLPDRDSIAVVGSRKSTSYGESVVDAFVPELVRAGFAIVSWGALGIDAAAHSAAIGSGGQTLAVMGTGIDRFYPSANRALYSSILDSWGAVVSHFPLGEEPMPYNFPIRNELVAAFSRWVLVVEASEKSGTLITARLALELGRDVFAPPADIGRSGSVGTNALLKNGLAKAVMSASDVIEEYRPVSPVQTGMAFPTVPEFSDPDEKSVWECVSSGMSNPDDVARHLGRPVHEVLPLLSILELSGYIQGDLAGNYLVKPWKR